MIAAHKTNEIETRGLDVITPRAGAVILYNLLVNEIVL